MKKCLLLFLLLIGYTISYAQNEGTEGSRAAQKYYKEAAQYIGINSYLKAISSLELAVKVDTNFAAAYQQLGDINRKLQRYELARTYYRKVLLKNPNLTPITYLGLGESELLTGEYTNAEQHFKEYLQKDTKISAQVKKIVDKYLKDCEFSVVAIKNPVAFKPVNMGPAINTQYQEYLPAMTADEETIIFTRQQNGNEDFYVSVKKNGQWQTATNLSPNINTIYNEGAQCISPDGMYLFFAGCNRPDGMGRCDIYVSHREGKGWSKPHNIGPPVNTPGWESQPSLSADGRTLYFVSTRPGGYGGYDIWKSELQQNGKWGEPENLGPNVNTAFDEQTPFIHPDNKTLYFSSNGWPGLGGKDVFLSRRDEKGDWQKPVNLGYPINTFGEETGLTISSDGKNAFFASDKAGGYGGLDLYSFELPVAARPNLVTYVKGIVLDAATNALLDADVQLIELKSNKMVYNDVTDAETGEFLATMPVGGRYALNVSKSGYIFYSDNFSLDKPTKHNKPYLIKVHLEKISTGAKMILKNIFFDTNKYDLLPESKVELQRLILFMHDNPTVGIEVDGFTDNIGDDKSNQVLSENRARTVYSYLLANKIQAQRLSFKGYGKAKPVADNNSEEGRKQNRRTEFIIIKK